MVWSFKFSTNNWTAKADMSNTKIVTTCGMITREEGEKEIVTFPEREGRVEIYNIATDTWRMGMLVLEAIDVSYIRNLYFNLQETRSHRSKFCGLMAIMLGMETRSSLLEDSTMT